MKKLFFAAVLLMGVSSMSMAKSIKLYEQPKADAKVVGTVESNAGIMTIFTPKEGGWVKVADPRNGNVGWVQSSELKGMGVHFNMMQVGDGDHAYQVIQYGDTVATPEQIEKMTKQMQQKQQALQNDMNRIMHDMFKDMQDYWSSSPVIMPVLVVPEKKVPAPAPAPVPPKMMPDKASEKK